MADHPAANPAGTADLLRRVTTAVRYSYEAGRFPDDMDPDVAVYVDGDGGLLNALDDAVRLAQALASAQVTIHRIRRERAVRAVMEGLTRTWLREVDRENAALRAQLDALTTPHETETSPV